jgi:hypothetical protein
MALRARTSTARSKVIFVAKMSENNTSSEIIVVIGNPEDDPEQSEKSEDDTSFGRGFDEGWWAAVDHCVELLQITRTGKSNTLKKHEWTGDEKMTAEEIVLVQELTSIKQSEGKSKGNGNAKGQRSRSRSPRRSHA